MADALPNRMTEDEFFAWIVHQDFRHELMDGMPRMMARADRRHDRIVVNALVALGTQLRGRPCRPFTGDTAVRIPQGNIRYPDLGVECGQPADRSMTADIPALVVEVLSPSTSQFDRTTKLEEYKTVPGLIHVLLVDPGLPRTRLYTRDKASGQWQTGEIDGFDAVVEMPAIDAALSYADLYDGIAFQPRPRLVY
jgi:Uma2 family endonuclease